MSIRFCVGEKVIYLFICVFPYLMVLFGQGLAGLLCLLASLANASKSSIHLNFFIWLVAVFS